MFQSTVTENFESWDNFLDAYYQPIRTALKLLPYVGESRADDLAQSFFLKMYERDILDRRPAITGKFRNWLYVAARRHAVDEWRKRHRRPERSTALGDPEPVDPNSPGAEDSPFDADEFYAPSILHMTVARVRKHLIEEGKSEHWMIFEELVLAPLMPGRVAKTREELQAMFPGQPSGFLDNRITTVKRVFRRHPAGARTRRPDREPDARGAVSRAARNPSRVQRQPAVAGLPDPAGDQLRRVDRFVARAGGPVFCRRTGRRDDLPRDSSRRAPGPTRVLAGHALERLPR